MSCVWCEDEDLAAKLIQSLSLADPPRDILQKALPDLYFCLECVYEYHRLKKKWITTTDRTQV